jgi:hypothetical protein
MNALLFLSSLLVLAVGLMLVSMASWRGTWPHDEQAYQQAQEKGLALLQSWLTPEQAAQWESRRQFEVIGCDTGTRYRITTKPGGMNINQLDATGRTAANWCFGPAGLTVTGDILLAQKIALETMEKKALAVANRQRAA